LETRTIEKEIVGKAREWIEEYGEDFLVELIDAYLDDAPARLAELRRAFENGDAETFTREAHSLKSSSANLGAMKVSAIAKEMEMAGRSGKIEQMAEPVARTEAEFALVRAALETLRSAPQEFTGREL
jgi:HPt (histidine-containing phosphotransfer) domain-containing protein